MSQRLVLLRAFYSGGRNGARRGAPSNFHFQNEDNGSRKGSGVSSSPKAGSLALQRSFLSYQSFGISSAGGDESPRFSVPFDGKSPMDLFSHLNDHVIEQYEAKKILSVAIYNHYCRYRHNRQAGSSILQDPPISLEKSNILLMGPSGCGKTLLAKTITKFLRAPFAICDATALTQAGYVGEDVESILFRLLQNAEFDVEKAKMGVIFIDEIDKIAKKKGVVHSSGRDVAGEGVQQALLKLLEGAVVDVPNKSVRKDFRGESFALDTSNILFILSGAFVDLPEIIAQRLKRSSGQSLGFHSEPAASSACSSSGAIFSEVQTDDLVEFGLIPEFIGRAPIIATLRDLSVDALMAAMTETKNCLLKQYQTLFSINGVPRGVPLTPARLSCCLPRTRYTRRHS